MTAGFHFDASCPRCDGELMADPHGPDEEHGPAADVQCRTCGAAWQIRVTVVPADQAPALCPYCDTRCTGDRGLRAHVGRTHPNRYEEPPMTDTSDDWLDAAACRGMDPEDFLPPLEDSGRPFGAEVLARIDAARQVCAGCPVTAECLADGDARTGWRDHSIRGGLTPRERRKVAASRPPSPVEEVA